VERGSMNDQIIYLKDKLKSIEVETKNLERLYADRKYEESILKKMLKNLELNTK
jgi:hypothetical protein